MSKAHSEISVNNFNERKTVDDEFDPYSWDKFIRTLVNLGYGDYEAAANSDIVEAAVFLYLSDSADERVRNYVYG